MLIALFIMFFILSLLLLVVAGLYLLSPMVCAIVVGILAIALVLYCLYQSALSDYKLVEPTSDRAIDVTSVASFKKTYHYGLRNIGGSILMCWALLIIPAMVGGYYSSTKRNLIEKVPTLLEQLKELGSHVQDSVEEEDDDYYVEELPTLPEAEKEPVQI